MLNLRGALNAWGGDDRLQVSDIQGGIINSEKLSDQEVQISRESFCMISALEQSP